MTGVVKFKPRMVVGEGPGKSSSKQQRENMGKIIRSARLVALRDLAQAKADLSTSAGKARCRHIVNGELRQLPSSLISGLC